MRKTFNCTVYLFEGRNFIEKYRKENEEIFDFFYDIDRDFDGKLSEVDIFLNLSQSKSGKLFTSRRFIDMKSNSILLSMGNHENIDIFALIEALNQHKIGGTWLDFREISLPKNNSPLFSTENLMLSCEILDSSGLRLERVCEGLVHNLDLFNKGKFNEMKGRIDPISFRLLG